MGSRLVIARMQDPLEESVLFTADLPRSTDGAIFQVRVLLAREGGAGTRCLAAHRRLPTPAPVQQLGMGTQEASSTDSLPPLPRTRVTCLCL